MLGLLLGWGLDELLFELVGLVLCLATWAVTGVLLGQGERPQEGATCKSLTPRANAGSLGPHPQS